MIPTKSKGPTILVSFHKEATRILLTGGGVLCLVLVVLVSFVFDSESAASNNIISGGAVQSIRPTISGNSNNNDNNNNNNNNNRSSTSSGFQHQEMMSTQKNRLQQQRHGVLCFGDSLTAGTSGYHEYPYATYLQQAMDDDDDDDETTSNITTTSASSASHVVVRHVGFPGWTVQQFRREVNHPQRGLVAWIQKWSTTIDDDDDDSSKLDVGILLGGTNDLGLRLSAGADAIADDIIELHRACHEAGVPRTIAIGIPSSAYQVKRSPEAAQLASSINQKLAEFCANNKPRATYVEFPFGYDQENMDKWYPDGLHFSEEGYRTLGRYLRPHVRQILQTLDENGDQL